MTNAVLKNNRICNQITFYGLKNNIITFVYNVCRDNNKFMEVFNLLLPQITQATYHRAIKDSLKFGNFTTKLMEQGRTFVINTYNGAEKTATIYVPVSPENNVILMETKVSKKSKNIPELLKREIRTFRNVHLNINGSPIKLQYLINKKTEKYDMKTVVNAKQFHNMLIKKKIFVDMQESNKIFDNFEITPRPVGVLSNIKKNKTK